MHSIAHPGPADGPRVQACPTRVTRRDVLLPAGHDLLAAATQALAPHTGSAMLVLQEGRLEALPYFWPALSASAQHAVFYSQRHVAAAPARLRLGAATLGRRDGLAWMHCHAQWEDATGAACCGHVVPDEARLATDLPATAWLLHDADFAIAPDAETNFTLFQPRPRADEPAATAGQPALALRLAPNIDACAAIEAVCRAHGFERAEVVGLGSTVGAVFDDGRRVEPFVTELFLRSGSVAPGADGAPAASLEVELVDYTGGFSSGRLRRGHNPVLVTMELLLIAR